MTGHAPSKTETGRVVALCGGVGGAKLAYGLAETLGSRLTIVVNTGDDFEHLGLFVSPDVDTVLYTLGRRADRERGWGRADETWNFMAALAEIGGETWFNLGDRDLALHVERTRRLQAAESLSAVVGRFATSFGIAARIAPMTDARVSTVVETTEGEMPFQRYFVGRRAEPVLTGVRFNGAAEAEPSAAVVEALTAPDLRAVVICPSNPFLSVDPILAVPGLRRLLENVAAPVVAVSPLIGGAAVKGPTAKIFAELSLPATSAAIAKHYGGLLDGLVIDETDAANQGDVGVAVLVTRTLMSSDEDRVRLAEETLAFADALAAGKELARGTSPA
ncbi:2-phospho-L-lactate transferase [Hansschlegelia sp.]|uniref:2-phospho-L-lactate transferase n=1 Tax=Hansschlegelia sp. TaxID=2041892 RepID=UPI002CFDEDEC|nr:2-phospho-L-lactate transferase [Hansschlegelia sp.]HVI27075.1 2-phospho-L-lactate transferase [Hansschlegelia sp.]